MGNPTYAGKENRNLATCGIGKGTKVKLLDSVT